MTFIHEDAEFDDLLNIVSAERKLELSLVEKDYWVTHALWAVHQCGVQVWFKGGTSLSKGFGLIQRFSEDLDLKIDSGSVTLPSVTNWKSDSAKHIEQRAEFFAALGRTLRVPGAELVRAPAPDPRQNEADFRLIYPGRHLESLRPPMRPFVLLQVGSARVTPFVERGMASFVHEHLERQGLLDGYTPNKPVGVRCVHPIVTLLEKLDAIHRRSSRAVCDPGTFVRHYEDAANIIDRLKTLPSLPEEYPSILALADEMAEEGQLARLPRSEDPGFIIPEGERGEAIRRAYEAIRPWYWGPRVRLEDACERIRAWIVHELEA